MKIIDTHSHLYDEAFKEDVETVVQRAQENGVEKILLPNINESTLAPMRNLCDRYPGFFYPMLGLHPTDVDADFSEVLDYMESLLRDSHPYIGIGEVGLDYYWDRTYYKEQQEVFIRQVEWALAHDLPLMIHSRSAHRELVDLLTPFRNKGLRGVFHSFGGTLEEARELLAFDGFVLGINGVVTFKKSGLPDVLRQIPMDRIVAETDSPYLTPAPFRGKRNESAYILYTLQKISEVYGLSVEEVAEMTRENTLEIFSNI